MAIIASSIILLKLIQLFIIKRLTSKASTTKTTIDDFLIALAKSSLMPLLYVVAVYASLHYLTFSERIQSIINIVLMVVTTFYVLRMITSFIGYLFNQALKRQQHNLQREKQSKGILLIIQVVVWVTGFLFLIDNLGYDITTLVAGLGIGGIAIALAAQAILGDLFSYLVIFFDRPFEIGDFIIIDDKMGTVEYIGIKTTRLRTLDGEQLICSNTDLTNSRVHNYKRMQERRIVFGLGVIYETSAAKLKIIPRLLKNIIESTGGTRFDRAHFKSFGDFSLNFEVVFYVLSPDYNTYMDIQERINTRIFELFEKEQIDFAFPTQTLFINKIHAPDLVLK